MTYRSSIELETAQAMEKTVNRVTAQSNMSFVPRISLSFA
jgi:hypothetical protein